MSNLHAVLQFLLRLDIYSGSPFTFLHLPIKIVVEFMVNNLNYGLLSMRRHHMVHYLLAWVLLNWAQVLKDLISWLINE